MKNLILTFCVVISYTSIIAQTKVSPLFSNHMILQQNTDVSIWGTDLSKQLIKVSGSWGASKVSTTNKNGKWLIKLKTPNAGGPYSINIKGSKTLILDDVMIGEVWFCSGQSNMEMPVKGYSNQPVLHSNEAILNSENTNIRVFTVGRNASLQQTNQLKGQWSIASPNTTPNYSAVAYFFAKKIENTLNIPIGIIVSSWGGSRIEAWMDEPSLDNFKEAKRKSNEEKRNHRHSSVLYNGMVKPIIGYTLKGMIWYQGEGNKGNYKEYPSLMKTMIGTWRKQWGIGDFPFYYAQIAPFKYPLNIPSGALLREAQLKASHIISNVGMVVTLDTGAPLEIHPMEKKRVGNRLAYYALVKNYNIKGIDYKSPEVEKINYLDNSSSVEVIFKNTSNGISSFGKELTNFELAGEDRVFYSATAKITPKKKNVITVSSTQVKKPIAIRYAFKNYAKASLFGTSGFPVSSFRSDNWLLK